MKTRMHLSEFSRRLLALVTLVAPVACSGSVDSGPLGAGAAAGAPPNGAGAPAGAGMAAGGATSTAGTSSAGTPGGGAPSGGGASSGAGAPSGGVGGVTGPATCSEAAKAFTVSAAALDPSLVPNSKGSGNSAQFPVAIDPTTNQVYVGFTRADGASSAAVIASTGGTPISIPGAVNAGIAATRDGVAALVFDPNTSVKNRTWAAVKRFRADGTEIFSIDMFRSPNLDDVGTKGAPQTSRFRYLAETDELIAYFGHTQRYDDGVRHQGGFVGRVSGAGMLEVLSGWWGSHNLDQRLVLDGGSAALIGLGDAYPEGIFYGLAAPRMRTTVIYPLAAAGNGATNGQLGGIVDFGDEFLVPFVTNRSVPQDLDAGTWPDIDDAIATQIREAAANGTDVGLLRVAKSGTIPMTGLTAVWVDVQRGTDARIQRLKSARYGSGGLTLLAWAEGVGTGRNVTLSYFTMVVDREGAVCQPRTPLDARFAFTAGDDIVRGPDGKLVWANLQGTTIQLVTLTPG